MIDDSFMKMSPLKQVPEQRKRVQSSQGMTESSNRKKIVLISKYNKNGKEIKQEDEAKPREKIVNIFIHQS